MSSRVLIASGGEAVTRIARACRQRGLHSIAMAQEPGVTHAGAADEVLDIPPGSDAETVAKVATDVKADAVHMGYASMVDSSFTRAFEALDVRWFGPDPDVADLVRDPASLAKAVESTHLVFQLEPSPRAREVSVLVAADVHGDVATIVDVDKSLAPLLLECPSPEFTFRPDGEALKQAVLEAARRLALALHSPGLFEVHFAIEPGGRICVQGVTFGLPRQHTLYQMVTGIDLATLQLDLTLGTPLPEDVVQPIERGHAIATSVLASEPADDWTLSSLTIPPAPQSRFRAERSAPEGAVVSSADAPLLLKYTCFGRIRHRALLDMDRALAETRLEPFKTNIATLREVLGHFSFRAGEYDRSSILTPASRRVA